MINKIIKRMINILRVLFLKITHPRSFLLSNNIFKITLSSIKNFDIKNGIITINGSIKVSQNSQIGVRDGGKITINDGFFSNNNFTCISHGSIEIGEYVSIGPNVCFYDHDHCFNEHGKIQDEFRVGKITVGNNVWIGAGVIILRDTVIGDNCVIGAGAVIKGNIPANSLVKSNREVSIEKLKKR